MLPTFGFVSIIMIPMILILSISDGSLIALIYIMSFTYIFIAIMSLVAQYSIQYWIQDEVFFYKTLFNIDQIPIETIRKIEVNATNWQSGSPATGNKNGIFIYYNRYDDLFITPKEISKFIEMMKSINPNIEVVYSK